MRGIGGKIMNDMIQSPKVIDGINWAFRAFNNRDHPETEDKVIPFRTFTDELVDGRSVVFEMTEQEEPPVPKPLERKKKAVTVEVMPGEPMPEGYPDYRPLLQRDGLILWAWELFDDFIKIVWLRSNGAMYRYQAVFDDEGDLATAFPEEKYNPGRRFYTEKEPDFIIYTAPDLTVNTRGAFIERLKASGVSVDFDYEFSLGKQRRQEEYAVADKINNYFPNQPSDMERWASFSIQPYLDKFIDELYEDGTVDRWKREKAEREARRGRYDRAAVMRSAWQYRKRRRACHVGGFETGMGGRTPCKFADSGIRGRI